MFQLKSCLVLCLILLSGFQSPKAALVKWVVSAGSSLNVGGSTNVNKFNCVIADYSKPDTLICYRSSSGPVKLSGSLHLEVQNFDCHNAVMTKDLRKTLKVKDFPELRVRFISLSKFPDLSKRSDNVKGIVAIELAGVLKQFEVDYKFVPDNAKSLTLIGSRQINFSDFNIVPPRKIGGMIQTKDELTVEFNLKMRVLD